MVPSLMKINVCFPSMWYGRVSLRSEFHGKMWVWCSGVSERMRVLWVFLPIGVPRNCCVPRQFVATIVGVMAANASGTLWWLGLSPRCGNDHPWNHNKIWKTTVDLCLGDFPRGPWIMPGCLFWEEGLTMIHEMCAASWAMWSVVSYSLTFLFWTSWDMLGPHPTLNHRIIPESNRSS